MGYAFISYSTKNQSAADAVRKIFQDKSIDTWMAPYDIPAGSKYAAAITAAIRSCACFVLLLSNDSQASEAVDSEVELAVLTFKKSVITVQLEDVILNDSFTFYIHNKQIIAVNAIDENSPQFKQVLAAVMAYVAAEGTSEKSDRGFSRNKKTKGRMQPADNGGPTAAFNATEAAMISATQRLGDLLKSFKIAGKIINVSRGPCVTRYDVKLDKDFRINKLITAADDIALNLGVSSVRIAAIPGKVSVVGIEVPHEAPTVVSLLEAMSSPEFQGVKALSPIAIGKNIDGACVVADIARLPHLLIAGEAGSGRTTCLNAIAVALMYQSSPDDVRLILIDSQGDTFAGYRDVPHLLIPIVTEAGKAICSLQWTIREMIRRYQAMSNAGVRNYTEYNSLAESNGKVNEKLPQLVIMVNELADMMKANGKDTEEALCRIAQMGRAAGIHLILATQHPSSETVTGLLKANIPSRIAFALPSAMASRTILDTQGAEKLIGRGDMLYHPIGQGRPERVQGCFVSDAEIESAVNYAKSHATTEYDSHILEEIEKMSVKNGN